MRLILVTVIISSITILSSCKDNGHQKEFSKGTFENGKYINKFLGFTIDIPENWYVYSEEELQKVSKAVESDESFNQKGKELIQKGKLRSSKLLMAQLYNPYTFDALVNPTFTINAERIDDLKFIKTAEDYMRLTRKTTHETVKNSVVFSDKARVELNGNLFDRHTIEKEAYGYKYKTTQFCEIMNGYAVLFTIIYANDYDRKELVKSLSSLDRKG